MTALAAARPQASPRADILAQTAALLRGGAATARLAELLHTLLSDLIAQPAGLAATWHPLGCLYVDLARTEQCSIRLHVWGADPAHFCTGALALHAHDFDLHSVLLSGAIEHQVVHIGPGAPTHQLYEIDYDGDLNHLRPTGRLLRVTPAAVQRILHGQAYALPAGHFHHVRPVAGELTATFVVADMRRGMRGALLGPIAGRDTLRTERRRCTESDLVAMLARVQHRLDGAGNGWSAGK